MEGQANQHEQFLTLGIFKNKKIKSVKQYILTRLKKLANEGLIVDILAPNLEKKSEKQQLMILQVLKQIMNAQYNQGHQSHNKEEHYNKTLLQEALSHQKVIKLNLTESERIAEQTLQNWVNTQSRNIQENIEVQFVNESQQDNSEQQQRQINQKADMDKFKNALRERFKIFSKDQPNETSSNCQ